jgi:transcriptional regulator with XRE-family HTH domain
VLRIDKISKSEKGFCNLEKEEKTEENLVKKTCRELGITQKELAEKIGVNPRTISVWSHGKIEKHSKVLLEALIDQYKYYRIIDLISRNNLTNGVKI